MSGHNFCNDEAPSLPERIEHTVSVRLGTMVVLIQTHEGLVVCADKRRVETGPNVTTFADDIVKIISVNERCGYVTLGATQFLDGETGISWFDADRVALEFFAENEICNPTMDQRFSACMVTSFIGYLRRLHPSVLPNTRLVDGRPVLFETLVFFVDASQRITIRHFEFLYERQKCRVVAIRHICSGLSGVFGAKRTMEQLESAPDAIWAAYRAEPIITLCRGVFLNGPVCVSAEAAVAYAKRLIEIAHKHEYPTSTVSTISAESDCVLLSADHGFECK